MIYSQSLGSLRFLGNDRTVLRSPGPFSSIENPAAWSAGLCVFLTVTFHMSSYVVKACERADRCQRWLETRPRSSDSLGALLLISNEKHECYLLKRSGRLKLALQMAHAHPPGT